MSAFVIGPEGECVITVASSDSYKSGGIRIEPPLEVASDALSRIQSEFGARLTLKAVGRDSSIYEFDVYDHRLKRWENDEDRIKKTAEAIGVIASQVNSGTAFTRQYKG